MKKIAIFMLSCIMLLTFAACAGTKTDPDVDETPIPTPTEEPTPTEVPVEKGFDLHFIDIGTGDGMLIVCDGEAMVIDSGNVGRGEKMVSYIKEQGVTSLKYLVVTHGHADHVGGMPEIIEAFPFETMLFHRVDVDEEPYKKLLSIIEEKKIDYVDPEIGSKFTLGGAEITILGPIKPDSNLNNNSIVMKLVYGSNSFLLCGDSQATAESSMLKAEMDLTADVWKANHHGSSAGCSKKFIEAVGAKYIVVQVGSENKLGYPDSSTMKRLVNSGAEVYRNDKNGDVVVSSDGTNITVKTQRVDE